MYSAGRRASQTGRPDTMTETHLCHGKFFERPYESLDSVWRRFLTVNPGVTYSRVRRGIMRNAKYLYAVEHALLGHCQSPGLPRLAREFNEPRRQCPKCARSLYHCSLFNLPWLARCPLHDVSLTDTCPDCSRPWPSPSEMGDRGCATCGCPSISDLFEYRRDALPESAFQILGDLDACTTTVEGHGLELAPTACSVHINWHRYRPTDSIYGDLLAELHALGPGLASALRRHDSGLRSFRFCAAPGHHFRHDDKNAGSIRHFLKRRQVLRDWAHTLAINTVVRAIERQTPNGHRLFLADYSLLGLTEFQALPSPCPYCVAFSLWMDHIVHSQAPAGRGLTEDRYPFLWELQAPVTSSLTPYLSLCDAHGVQDLPDPVFARLYYRSLLLIFRDFLELAQRLQSVHKNPDCRFWSQPQSQSNSGWGYYLGRKEEILMLVLIRDHPLKGDTEDWPTVSSEQCLAFLRQLDGRRDPGLHLIDVASVTRLGSSFTRLIRHFIAQHPSLLSVESTPWSDGVVRRF